MLEHKTIPFDKNPPNYLGFKFAKTNTSPVICSKVNTPWRPEAI